MKYFLFIILGAHLLMCVSCKEEEPRYTQLKEVVKEYVFFWPSSKWVYQNDSTLATDTVTVTSSYINKTCKYIDGITDHCWDHLEITYFSSANNKSFTDRSGYEAPNNIYRGWDNLVFTSDHSSSKFKMELLNNLLVGGETYARVWKLHYDNSSLSGTTGYKAFDFYWAPHHGNIKKVIYEGSNVTSWSLIYKEVHQ